VLSRKRDEVTREWRKLHNEELNDLYCSLSIVRMIKSRRMRWAGHVAHMGREEALFIYVWFYHLVEPDVDERIILRWIFRKWDVEVWTGSSWLRIGTGGWHL